jgi:hypothetical protein
MSFPFAALLLLANLLYAQDGASSLPANEFIFPGPAGTDNNYMENPSWSHDSIHTIEWTCNYTQWTLYVYHNDGLPYGDAQRLSQNLCSLLLLSANNLQHLDSTQSVDNSSRRLRGTYPRSLPITRITLSFGSVSMEEMRVVLMPTTLILLRK